MKRNRTASTWLLFVLLVSLLVVASSGNSVPASLSAKAQDLWQLQAASDKVVPLDTALFDTHASGKGRPYALVVFMTAEYMMDKGQLQLRKLRQEYGMAAKAFAKKHEATEHAGKVFFTEVSLTKSGDLFHRMGVQHLPYVAIIPGSQSVKAGAAISLPDDQRMKHEMFDHYPWTAEDFCGFISDHTGLGCAEIHRPTLASNPLFPIIMVAVLSALGYIGWKVYMSEFIKNKAIWVAACLFVYWFATSGGLYNIIRGIPLTMPDHASGKIRWFMPGQGQLGAEGFFNGTMYLLFTLCMVSITQFHHSSDFLGSKGKGMLMYVLLLCMLFVGIKVYDFYTFKTGMRFKTYLF